jgi:hypothetical protein
MLSKSSETAQWLPRVYATKNVGQWRGNHPQKEQGDEVMPWHLVQMGKVFSENAGKSRMRFADARSARMKE